VERWIVRVVCGTVDPPRRRCAHGRGDLALVVLDSLTATINGVTWTRTAHVISLPETHWTFFCRQAAATC